MEKNMNFSDMTFIRKFSMNLYKNLNIPLSKMSFTSDFLNTVRGNPYPLISADENVSEHANASGYSVSGGTAERLMAEFFPFATYKMKISSLFGKAGFVFVGPDARCEVLLEKDEWDTHVTVKHNDGEEKFPLHRDIYDDFALLITARPGHFDVYTAEGDAIEFLATAKVPCFANSTKIPFYQKTKAHTYISGNAYIKCAESYIDCGISQADIRPFRYENGELIMENGRVFLAISSRMATGGHQSVLSWLPGTADFRMEGALYYSNPDDDAIHGEVAASYVFNRMDGKWHVWIRNGSAGHVLAYASFDFDIRFGINILDVKPLPIMTPENLDDRVLLGKKADEDPDFTYDAERKKWLFALCRVDEETHKYRYFFFESDRPDSGYEFVGLGPAGEETGGSIVRLDGKIFFVCGNSFSATSDYRVYEWGKFDTFTNLKCDYPDGGFRGWGTVMPIRYGSRIRYFWLTFDRKLLSKTFNWSYGNLYCFEAEGIFRI